MGKDEIVIGLIMIAAAVVLVFKVEKHKWVQIPSDAIGIVVAQVGAQPETGAKSGIYKSEFGDLSDLSAFINNGEQRGLQRPVLPPHTTVLFAWAYAGRTAILPPLSKGTLGERLAVHVPLSYATDEHAAALMSAVRRPVADNVLA